MQPSGAQCYLGDRTDPEICGYMEQIEIGLLPCRLTSLGPHYGYVRKILRRNQLSRYKVSSPSHPSAVQ